MSELKHDLVSDLPELRDQIHQLKMHNHHFARLFNEYHELDHEVVRLEQGVEHSSDAYLEGLKAKRVHLKDELYRMASEAQKESLAATAE